MQPTRTTHIRYEVVSWYGPLEPHPGEAWDYLAKYIPETPIYNYRAWFEIAYEAGVIQPWGVVIVRFGDRPIGLFPLQKRTPWSWELIAYFAQGGPQWLIDPAMALEAWQGLGDWMRNTPGVHLLYLGSCHDAGLLAKWREAFRTRHLATSARISKAVMVWSDLPASWEDFLSAIGRISRKDMLRAEKVLQRDFPDTEVRFLSNPDECARALDELITLYRQRWSRQFGGCCFDEAKKIAFYKRAFTWAVEQGYATMSVLRVRQRNIVLSTKFHLPGQSVLYEQFVARDLATLPARYSPGIVEFSRTVRWAIGQGITRINLGVGQSRYKSMFGGKSQLQWEILAARSPLAARVLPRIDRSMYLVTRIPVYLCYLARCAICLGKQKRR